MISADALAVAYGLGSALTWGAADFSGGVASKKAEAPAVIFYSQGVGLLFLVSLYGIFPGGTLTMRHFIWGGLAGVCGALGLIALYKGLAMGRMGIVAPLSAVITAIVPVILAFFTEGLPTTTRIMGFGMALLAIGSFSAANGMDRLLKAELVLSLLAGLGFGLFFICIDHVSGEAIFWPLVSARLASITIMGVSLAARRQLVLPPRRQLMLIALAGILDITGNTFFALASRIGRLDVSAVLASMYPASTVLLARCILKERLRRRQQIGLAAACMALVLIAR
jgi:drug/metabolite transporter (DMT)-like permease